MNFTLQAAHGPLGVAPQFINGAFHILRPFGARLGGIDIPVMLGQIGLDDAKHRTAVQVQLFAVAADSGRGNVGEPPSRADSSA